MRALDDIWRTSSRSGGNGACVEVRFAGGVVEVRDSKDRSGPTLAFDPDSWRNFLASVRDSR